MVHLCTFQKDCDAQWNYQLILELMLELGTVRKNILIADKASYVSYLEGCTASYRDENQLHAAVVELIALDNARD